MQECEPLTPATGPRNDIHDVSRMTTVLRLGVLLGAALLCACQSLQELPLSPFSKRIPYSITVNDQPELEKLLQQELDLYRRGLQQEQFSQPRKIAFLERQLLQRKLHSEGYYASRIRLAIEPERLRYGIDAGPLYRIAKLSIRQPSHVHLSLDEVPLASGMPLKAAAVLDARKLIETKLQDRFCLLRPEVSYRVILDHAANTADLRFRVSDSPEAEFGTINIEGLHSVEASYLLDRLPFRSGDCYKRKLLDRARLNLLQTNLVASISIEELPPQNRQVPIRLHVTERAHKTVTAGAGFETDEGLGVSAGWEHRNLRGRGEKLTVDAYLAENAQRLSSRLTFPHYRRNAQTLTIYTELSSENPDAYESESGAGGVELTRQVNPHLRVLLGGDLTFSRVTDDDQSEDFALLSLPVNFELDYRNDPLDPVRGWIAALNIRPYWDAYDTGIHFIRTTLASSIYWSPAVETLRPTLALRGALGGISGVERERVPANVRFYAGGGGSVRGYAYQSIGPLDSDDKPEGGLSFAELSAEARLRWGQDWGVVLFLDGGSAFTSSTPDFDRSMLWGAGIGLRYYTSFAPIRFDIGVPLDRRDDLDSAFQIYISIGQAF